jgi:hypothetical protein
MNGLDRVPKGKLGILPGEASQGRRLSRYIADATTPLNHSRAIDELLSQNAVATGIDFEMCPLP